MIGLPPSVRIYIATRPTDMRKSFDGLLALVEQELRGEVDAFSGHLFVFRNRRGDKAKLLFWDRSGFCIYYKRLEKGTFRFPMKPEGPGLSVQVEFSDLLLLLEGIDLAGARRRRRWAPRRQADRAV